MPKHESHQVGLVALSNLLLRVGLAKSSAVAAFRQAKEEGASGEKDKRQMTPFDSNNYNRLRFLLMDSDGFFPSSSDDFR